MRMIAKYIIMKNFRGIKDLTVNFNENVTKICGENGLGKTSIPSAWFWVWGNRDYELISNPDVRCNTADDTDVVFVEIGVEIDGKPVTICKRQKFKRSKPDVNGVTKTSTTNGYEVNAIECSETAFAKKMEEDYGVDLKKIMELSHPGVFISGMNDKKSRDSMRETLFGMSEDFTDIQIAEANPDTKDLAELLKNYKLSEVEAMNKQAIRRIDEECGKKNEIINAKIAGLIAAKSDESIDEMENRQKGLENQIAEVERRILSGTVDVSDLQNELATINVRLSEIKAEEDEKLREVRSKLKDSLDDAERRAKDLRFERSQYNDKMIADNKSIADNKAKIDKLRMDYEEIKNHQMDEKATICKMCGRPFESDKIDEIKRIFEENRKNDLKEINEQAKKINAEIKDLGGNVDKWNDKISTIDKEIETVDPLVDGIKSELAGIPMMPNYEENDEYKELLHKKDVIEIEMAEMVASKPDTAEDEVLLDDLKKRHQEVVEKIGQINGNTNIDKKIEELRQKIIDFEQQRANADKVLYQVKLLSMQKNKMFEESVNKHFRIVKWKLFDVQKNGEVFDTCVPMIDGYRYDQQSNKGRRFLAKTDIVDGLQRFYGQYFPAFIDDFESLSSNTADRIQMDCQAIFLKVTEDDELQFM